MRSTKIVCGLILIIGLAVNSSWAVPPVGTPSPAPASTASTNLDESSALRAMIIYVDGLLGSKGHASISHVVVHGTEAAGVVEIIGLPDLEGEHALVLMKISNGKWEGVDYGTGLDAPAWYPHW